MRAVVAAHARLDLKEHGDVLEIRNDVPERFQQELFQNLVLAYRSLVAEEPPLIHTLAKPIAIGMLELAIRTGTKVEQSLPPQRR